jgi:hypothetical protein
MTREGPNKISALNLYAFVKAIFIQFILLEVFLGIDSSGGIDNSQKSI